MKAGDFINDVLQEIGAHKLSNQVANSDNAAVCLRRLNWLIETTNIIPTLIYRNRTDELTLTPNKQTYTIGATIGEDDADFDIPRPSRIESIVVQLQSEPNVLRSDPLTEIDDATWASRQISGVYSVPTEFNYDPAFPHGVISFFPIPSTALVIELASWFQIAAVSELDDEIIVPPGYSDLFFYHLAIRLCGPFDRPVTPSLIEMERRATAAVVALNSKPVMREGEPALTGGPCGFDWRTGSLTGR